MTLVDSGSSISMVRSTLLPPHLPVVCTSRIACFHGHTEDCPVVQVHLYYMGQPGTVEMARVRLLPYHALLGRDAPAFHEVVAVFLPSTATWAVPAEEGTDSPATSQPRPPAITLECLLKEPQCLRDAQEADTSLTHLRNMELVSEGQMTDKRRAGQWPRIVVTDGVWRREVSQKAGAPSQVLLPSPWWHEALESLHDHLWAGHQGIRNTQKWLEHRFFWPALRKDVRAHCRACPVCQRYNKKPAP